MLSATALAWIATPGTAAAAHLHYSSPSILGPIAAGGACLGGALFAFGAHHHLPSRRRRTPKDAPQWRDQITRMGPKQVAHLEALEDERVGYSDRLRRLKNGDPDPYSAMSTSKQMTESIRQVDEQICLARDHWSEPEPEPAPDFGVKPEPFDAVGADLKGEPVRLLVENNGPACEFEAIVENIGGAQDSAIVDGRHDRLAFPWNVRWRDSQSPTLRIGSGEKWLLEVGREDVMHGSHPPTEDWQPQWIYYTPSGERAVRPKQIPPGVPGARDSYYQELLVTMIRVFPLGRPDKAVMMTGEFGMSQSEGATVRWR